MNNVFEEGSRPNAAIQQERFRHMRACVSSFNAKKVQLQSAAFGSGSWLKMTVGL